MECTNCKASVGLLAWFFDLAWDQPASVDARKAHEVTGEKFCSSACCEEHVEASHNR